VLHSTLLTSSNTAAIWKWRFCSRNMYQWKLTLFNYLEINLLNFYFSLAQLKKSLHRRQFNSNFTQQNRRPANNFEKIGRFGERPGANLFRKYGQVCRRFAWFSSVYLGKPLHCAWYGTRLFSLASSPAHNGPVIVIHTHTHTYTQIYIYTYIFIFLYICT